METNVIVNQLKTRSATRRSSVGALCSALLGLLICSFVTDANANPDWYDSQIMIKFAELPPFDTVSGDVFDRPDFDTVLYQVLDSVDCDSVLKVYWNRTDDQMAKWYRAYLADSVDIEALWYRLGDISCLDAVSLEGYELGTFTINDSCYVLGYNNMDSLFSLLNLDSAISLLDQGDTAIAIAISHMPTQPNDQTMVARWGHEDLIDNLKINHTEDSNQNGQVDPWPSNQMIGGVYGDFDNDDDDGDGIIDNILFGRWTWEQLDGPWDGHETPTSGVAVARSNDVGYLGSCPSCTFAPILGTVDQGLLSNWGFNVMSKSYESFWVGKDGQDYTGAFTEDWAADADGKNIVTVQNAGNEYGEILSRYGLDNPHHIVVTCFNMFDPTFDDFSVDRWSYHSGIDFCLPHRGYGTTAPEGGYGGFSNTSAAAPMMAGIYGLMMSYSLHNDTLNWTIDSITNRLKYHSTRIEQFWDDQTLPEYGKVGAGYPNVYQAMIDRGTYHSVTLINDNQSFALNNLADRLTRPILAGDTILSTVGFRSDVCDYDTVIVSFLSHDFSVNMAESAIMLSVDVGDTARDSLTFVIPPNVEPGEYALQAEVSCDGSFCDTLFYGILLVNRTPEKIITATIARNEDVDVSDYWPLVISYGNVDSDANLEAVFYLFDSLYCIDLSTYDVESGFPKPCAALDTSDLVPRSRILAPAVGDLNGDGRDEILYSPSRTQIGLISGNGSSLYGFPVTSSTYYVSPVLADIDMNGYLDIVHLASNKLYMYRMGVPSGFPPKELPYTLESITVANDIFFHTSSACVGDMNGDGLPEIVVIADQDPYGTNEGIYILNHGSDTVIYSIHQGAGDEIFGAPKLADFDADGFPEALYGYAYVPQQTPWLESIEWDTASASFSSSGDALDNSGNGTLSEVNGTFDSYSFFDIDGDHFPEVVSFVILGGDGDIWTIYWDSNRSYNYWFRFKTIIDQKYHEHDSDHRLNQPVVGRLNTDSIPDFVIAGYGYSYTAVHDVAGNSPLGEDEIHLLDFMYHPVVDNLGNSVSISASEAQVSVINAGDRTIIADYRLWRSEGDTVSDNLAVYFYEFDTVGSTLDWPLQRCNSQLTGNHRKTMGGTIVDDITIRDTVYLVGDLVIPSGTKLTIKPGTVIKVIPGDKMDLGDDSTRSEIIVNGTLDINGTSTKPVVFASLDETEGDWYGIVIDSGTADIKYADISHAYAGIYDKGDEVDSIINCHISDCELYGIRITNSNVVVKGCKIEDIYPGYGIHIFEADSPTIHHDTVSACQRGIYISCSDVVVEDCVTEGGLGVWITRGCGDTTTVQELRRVTLLDGGMYINHGRVSLDSCVIKSTDTTNALYYGVIVWWLWYGDVLEIRNTDIIDYKYMGVQMNCAFLTRADFGRDATGEHGNNAIHSSTPDANYLYTTGGYYQLNALHNWWGQCPPDTTLFALEETDTVNWDPCLSSAPRAKALTSDGEPLLPTTFALYQNYPNPFNPSTVIKFDIPKVCEAKLEIFNILGQRVVTLADQSYLPGTYTVVWYGTNRQGKRVASGVYFYRLRSDSFVSSKKMMLLK